MSKATQRPTPRKVTTKTRTTNKTRNATLIGSLISVNVGPRGAGRKRPGGGLFARLKGAGMRSVAALKGADYATTAKAPRGGGGFEGFRAQRPDLFDTAPDQDTAAPDTHDDAALGDDDSDGGDR